MKAVIMAAGESTRTHPLTLTRPKPLLPVANRTILEHQVLALKPLVSEIVLVAGYRHEMIRERYQDSCEGVPLRYIEQVERKGTGHALLQCKDALAEPFLVLNGDDLYAPEDLARLAQQELSALVKTVEDPRNFGIYDVDTEGKVRRLVEKPEEVFSNLANIGAYHLTPAVFPVLEQTQPSSRGEIELTSAINALAQQQAFYVVEAEEYWLPIVYPWSILDANEFWLHHYLTEERSGTVSSAAHLNGVVSVGPGTVIYPGAYIEGPVLIGANCHVGPNCYIRPATTLGDGCKVGHGVEVKNSVFFNKAKAPHLNYVGDSVLGEGVNLGCGTITANFRHDGRNHRSVVKGALIDTGRRKLGAIFGDGVHTAIHTSIYGGRKMWPHTSTRPGDVVQRDIEEA